MKKYYILFFTLLVSLLVFGQEQTSGFFKPSDTLNLKRRNATIITEASLFTASMIGLDQLWYSDFDRTKFRTVNDADHWLQMDKFGHIYSSYHLGRVGANVLKWSGVSEENQLLYGATLGLGFLTAVEVFDGYSKEWGFSWADMAANAAGSGLYVGQELLWDEQRITLKYSFHQTRFADQRPETLGNGFMEQFLKDYNGQTYWLSFNLKSFFKQSKIPAWLNLAVGVGADGMLTSDGLPIDGLYANQNHTRNFYLSFDVDLSRIKTNSHFFNTLFDVFNTLKMPFPTVEFNDKSRIKLHGIYY